MRGQHWMRVAVAAILCAGCGRGDSPKTSESAPAPALAVPNPSPKETNADRLHQPFEAAVLEESPGNQQPPPDLTRTGLATPKLRLDVQKSWDSIRFVDEAGKSLAYTARFDTDRGSFTVLLSPDDAPNHVRNFVALARCGYYNGLLFEHVIQQTTGEDGTGPAVEIVEGGCPLGSGEPGVGHLGYWLRPEFSDTVKHESGTFGAFHDDRPDSAACRFYITLTPAPAMDGQFTAFGRVVEGLDVVRTISRQPRIDGSIIPVNPVTIRSVSIRSEVVR